MLVREQGRSKQYSTPSTHHLQLVPTSIPHCLHITYSQYQTVYHTVYTSPIASTNQYTILSKHHLQLVPTSIPHCLHITYSYYQPVYHTVYTSPTAGTNQYTTVYTSPTASTNQYTTLSIHHLQLVPTSIPHFLHITYTLYYNSPHHHTTTSSITLHRLNNFNAQYFNNYPFLT